jgi:hypothetical protein
MQRGRALEAAIHDAPTHETAWLVGDDGEARVATSPAPVEARTTPTSRAAFIARATPRVPSGATSARSSSGMELPAGVYGETGSVIDMAGHPGDCGDMSVEERLYLLAEGQGGFFTAQQAIEAGVARSTLTYHARDGGALRRAGRGVYRLRRFPASPHEQVVCAWLGLSRAGGVVSHVSALEQMKLTDLIADEVHVTVPRAKRGVAIPAGVRVHFTTRSIDEPHRITVAGIPVTGVERTIADVVRADGWSEQIDLAVRQSLRHGMTTPGRLSEALPKTWRRRLQVAASGAHPRSSQPGDSGGG